MYGEGCQNSLFDHGHTDPEFVAHTVDTLSYGDDGFFIHVDKRVNIEPFSKLLSGKKNVCLLKEREMSFWGGYNALKAMIKLFIAAFNENKYERFIILQGQDYPLFSPRKIHQFFNEHRNVEYCHAENVSDSESKDEYMKCCGYWNNDLNGIFGTPFKKVLHLFNRLGIKFRKSHIEGKSIYQGWAHVALTKECVSNIIKVYKEDNVYNRYMSHCFPPDETYIQTIVHNSKFKDQVDKRVVLNRENTPTKVNLTYFEYHGKDGVLHFNKKSDYEWLVKTGCLFARKINSSSSELVEEIDKHIKENDEES